MSFRSSPRPQDLIAQGVREITLIGQDTTCYGEDLGFTDGLATLLDALAVLPGLRWLRFLYGYINKVSDASLETMAKPRQHRQVSRRSSSARLSFIQYSKQMKRGGNALRSSSGPHREGTPHRSRHRHPNQLHRGLPRRNRSLTTRSSEALHHRCEDRLARRLHLLRRRGRQGL